MKKSRYTEEQIAFALRQGESGTPVKEVIRKLGITEQTYYRWKQKYGGLGVSEGRVRSPSRECLNVATRREAVYSVSIRHTLSLLPPGC